MGRFLALILRERLLTCMVLVGIVFGGLMVSPFGSAEGEGRLPRFPVAADAIPDLGENQQIVFTAWPGNSPRDVEDQVTYPLTVALLGVPGVKTIRSNSIFGFSSIYIIFNEDIDFYWARSRILEKLNSLPAGTLPGDVQPALGPDSTGLGQVFWYTLEGRDAEGNASGGFDLDELRAIQDWTVRYALTAVDGVSEVASIGGFEREYVVEVDPDALHAFNVDLKEVQAAVRGANMETGAGVLEFNRVEYILRGKGWIDDPADIASSPIRARDGTPLRVQDVAHVTLGPAPRRGALDKDGHEVVGGVVTVRYGTNPLEVLDRVKEEITRIAPSLPRRTMADGSISQVTIVPFYDRTGLIHETLGTLEEALVLQVLVTMIVILLMLWKMRAAFLVALTLPVTVFGAFVLMKVFEIEANIVALSGIAIAIGTIADMGIVLSENILQRLQSAPDGESRFRSVHQAATEVGGAVMTAVLTTIIGFLPVFVMTGAEGKLFKPLAFTKTFTLVASIVVALLMIPTLAMMFFRNRNEKGAPWQTLTNRISEKLGKAAGLPHLALVLGAAVFLALTLSGRWQPLGVDRDFTNFLFVALLIGSLLLLFWVFHRCYAWILAWCLRHKLLFLSLPIALALFGSSAWLGFDKVFGFIPNGLAKVGVEKTSVYRTSFWREGHVMLPGFGKEFMPPLDEGSFLYMPTTPPHASMQQAVEMVGLLDQAISSIPEIESSVGKIGRAETALDPAPISMVENVILYKPEFGLDEEGERVRLWRDEIQSPDDIWNEVVSRAKLLGVTSAPKLQPIETRLVMLQSGMRAPMGIKVAAPDLERLEEAALILEGAMKEMPGVVPATVFADRVIGKPYLEVEIRREDAARYGLTVAAVQEHLMTAFGGKVIAQSVEGRERFNLRLRYPHELRGDTDDLRSLWLPLPQGGHVPLAQVADVGYRRGPQVIKTEDTFLTAYVTFDREPQLAEVDVVENAQAILDARIADGSLMLPEGVTYRFAGTYENQVRASRTLAIVLPVALLLILVILQLNFRSLLTTLMVFSGVFVAWSGGFLMLWLYGQEWFLDFSIFGSEMRDLFQVKTLNLSVAVWVGFLALFGIATDDGVIMGTYLQQSFRNRTPKDREEVRAAVLEAGKRRVGPCLMTTATTMLALLPVLTSTGRGADVMVPMAIPSFGGMCIALLTMFVVPVLYSAVEERRLLNQKSS
ncbi:MAG: efflux RND transporter permease subunit [Planctomycetota bacterium]